MASDCIFRVDFASYPCTRESEVVIRSQSRVYPFLNQNQRRSSKSMRVSMVSTPGSCNSANLRRQMHGTATFFSMPGGSSTIASTSALVNVGSLIIYHVATNLVFGSEGKYPNQLHRNVTHGLARSHKDHHTVDSFAEDALQVKPAYIRPWPPSTW